MPIKTRLIKAEEGKYIERLKELQAAGCNVDIPDDLPEASLPLRISVLTGSSSLVCDLPTGGVAYVIWVRLVANKAGVTLVRCWIETEWDNRILLQFSDSTGPIRQIGGLEYPTTDVLNERIENGLWFYRRGDTVEGVILAFGTKPLPAAYIHGLDASVKLTFADQFGQEIPVDGELFVDRTQRQRTKRLRPGDGLYGPGHQNKQPTTGSVTTPISTEAVPRHGGGRAASTTEEGQAEPSRGKST